MNPRIVLLLCLLALVLPGCGSTPEALPADVDVIVNLKDYSVTVNVTTIKAGPVKIGVRNLGATEHSFELIRTDLAPDKLPVDATKAQAKEDGLVKQVKSIRVGKVATVTADLAPGHYVIICNVAGHYQLGMRADLKVE